MPYRRYPQRLLSSDAANDVLILGAGFSHEVSAVFPVTDELGTRAARRASRPILALRAIPEFRNGNFEAWLSRIAEPQPHLTERENLDNAALFGDMKVLIYEILTGCEEAAFVNDAKPWLYELLSVLHFRQASVITFNYDTVLEVGVLSSPLWGWGDNPAVEVDDILADLPSAATPRQTYNGGLIELTPTFRLFKLHGSLNWYAAQNDLSGATLRRAPVLHRFGAPRHYPEEERVRELPGREPYLVPPSATKSTFYQNPIMREIWRGAFQALRKARRVSLLGYSMPTADLVFAGVFQEALLTSGADEGGPQLEIVNPDPEPVHDHLAVIDEALSESADDIETIPNFVANYVQRSSLDLVGALSSLVPSHAEETRIAMPWGAALNANGRITAPMKSAFEVLDRRSDDGSVIVDFRSTSRRPIGDEGDVIIRLSEFKSYLEGASGIRAMVSSDREVPVVGAWYYPADGFHTPQLILAPAGKADDLT